MSGWSKWFKRRDAAPAKDDAVVPEHAVEQPAGQATFAGDQDDAAVPEQAVEPVAPVGDPPPPPQVLPGATMASAAILACEASRQQLAAQGQADGPRDAPTELLHLNRWYQGRV